MTEFLSNMEVRTTFLTMMQNPEAIKEKTEKFSIFFYKSTTTNNNNTIVPRTHEGYILKPPVYT